MSAVFGSHIFDLLRGEHDVTGPMHGPGKVYNDPALSGGGMGHLQMTHPLRLLFFITGLPIRRVHALMSSHGLAVDLVNAFTVEFANGAIGAIGVRVIWAVATGASRICRFTVKMARLILMLPLVPQLVGLGAISALAVPSTKRYNALDIPNRRIPNEK